MHSHIQIFIRGVKSFSDILKVPRVMIQSDIIIYDCRSVTLLSLIAWTMRYKTLALRIIPFVVYLICLMHFKVNKKSTIFIRRTLTASSASEGEILIMGLSGQAIGFRGRSGAWYSTISSRSLQWNMRLHSYDNCPKNANNFVSGFGLTLFKNRKPCKRIDVNVINPYGIFPLEASCGVLGKSHCLGAGSLEISIDEKRYVVSGDYRFDDAPGRVLVFNTDFNCKQRWHAFKTGSLSRTSDKINNIVNRMFSKLIPRKSSGFEVRVTDNPRWQAPIPLYPEPTRVKPRSKRSR
jgi:hypothetical protein